MASCAGLCASTGAAIDVLHEEATGRRMVEVSCCLGLGGSAVSARESRAAARETEEMVAGTTR